MDSEIGNFICTIIFGLGTVWSLIKGQIFFKYAGTVTRSEQPLMFWALIYFNLGLTAFCGYFWLRAY